MTLLITVFAAIICTIIWYTNENRSKMNLGVLSLMYWGASLMWLVDAIFEFAEDHEAYFNPEMADVFNDAFLGISVVALGLIAWTIILLIKDPLNVIKSSQVKKKQ